MVFVMNMSNIEIHEETKKRNIFYPCNPISQVSIVTLIQTWFISFRLPSCIY